MLAATKVKMSRSEEKSKPEHIRYFLHKKCHVHLKFHVVVMQNNDKKCTKKCITRAVFFFLPIRSIGVFNCSSCFRRLALQDFIFYLSKL